MKLDIFLAWWTYYRHINLCTFLLAHVKLLEGVGERGVVESLPGLDHFLQNMKGNHRCLLYPIINYMLSSSNSTFPMFRLYNF